MTAKRTAQYGWIDAEVCRVLKAKPMTTPELRQELGITSEVWAIVRQRLSGQRKIRCISKFWEVARPSVKRDTSPFPRPWWWTPKVGFFG